MYDIRMWLKEEYSFVCVHIPSQQYKTSTSDRLRIEMCLTVMVTKDVFFDGEVIIMK
jgi:hypothetical protein